MAMRQLGGLHKLALAVCLVTTTLVLIVGVAWGIRLIKMKNSQANTPSPDLATAGFPLSGDLAPDFTLVDQFGQSHTLSSMRGQEVVLAFIDSRCKTLCPLTATIMYNARQQLGASASKVALVAVNANPNANSTTDVEAWSISHGMLHQWLFLTGTAQQLQTIYQEYKIYDEVTSDGTAVHDPATFIIDAQGHERLYFETLDSNAPSDIRDQEVAMADGMRQWLPQS
jgi:cytochrome oxidase Cu insertion factor (SCO1/SenC/PrrC family)